MSIKVELKGAAGLQKQLSELPKFANEMFAMGLKKAVTRIQEVAVKSIHAHQSQGRRYGRHVASLPGYPPNTDTGRGANSIKWEIDEAKLVAAVGSNEKYMAELEVGRVGLAPRPWLRPAVEKVKPEIVRFFKLRVKK